MWARGVQDHRLSVKMICGRQDTDAENWQRWDQFVLVMDSWLYYLTQYDH